MKGIITMFEEIITSKELKFNDLEKKVYRFVCFIGCLIIKLILESYDRKIMQSRDKEKYRHKGLRETLVLRQILEGIWTEEETINKQREILEKMFENLVGKISLIDVQKKKIDTTMLTKNQVLEQINSFTQTKEEKGER